MDTSSTSSESLFAAIERLLAPIIRLCLANGVNFAALEELLKRVFVQQAHSQLKGGSHGAVSRVSTATGIRRREVTRLLSTDPPARAERRPLAAELLARWTTNPAFLDGEGAPAALKRQGDLPSFESLACSVTRDVHPRSMLDEMIRLGLARHDAEDDLVVLVRSEFVPKGDSGQMLAFLANNVGDHFDAAVANVLDETSGHLEQAVFADELSQESLEALRPLVEAQWQALCGALIPALTALIEEDAAAGRPQNQRVRIGLYSYSETVPGEGTETAPANKPQGVCQ